MMKLMTLTAMIDAAHGHAGPATVTGVFPRHVRRAGLASDDCQRKRDVRFTPMSRHRQRGWSCLKSANWRHR
jgi:hypothetical protein